MKNFRKYTLYLVLSIVGISIGFAGTPNTQFNYQGEVIYNGSPANGVFTVRFELYHTLNGGTALDFISNDYSIENGLLDAELDYGDFAFDGANLWLGIVITDPLSVNNSYDLVPRVRINTAPYSIQANFVADNKITSASILNGSILGEDLSNFAINNNKIENQTIGFEKFSINGASNGDIIQYNDSTGEWESTSLGMVTSPWISNVNGINYNSGNVGIGTINPTGLLHIQGNSTDELQLFGGSSSPVIHFRRNVNAADWVLKQNADGGKFHIQSELADGNEVLTVDNAGKVGIGTIAPNGVLDVRNNSDEVLLNIASDGRIDRKAQTKTLIVGYKSFVPVSSIYSYSTLNFLGMNGIISDYTGGGPAKFQANVRLPKNAVVTKFEAITGDNSPIGAAVVKFGYQPFALSNGIITLSTLTSSNIPFGEIISATVNTTILIDRMYFIDVDLDRITTGGQNVLFAGARITYTIDEL